MGSRLQHQPVTWGPVFFLSPTDKPHAPSPVKPHVKPRANWQTPGTILKNKTHQHLPLTRVVLQAWAEALPSNDQSSLGTAWTAECHWSMSS